MSYLLQILRAAILTHGLAGTAQAQTAQPVQPAKPCELRVVTIQKQDFSYGYYYKLLELALAKTADRYGPCRLVQVASVSHTRKFAYMRQDKLDVIWNVSTVALQSAFRPISVPVHKGLHGFRLLVIRKGDASLFSAVRSREDLARFKAGVIHDWQVTSVLRTNNLPYTDSSSIDSLFTMLERRRFDYLPLGLFEVYGEAGKRQRDALAVDTAVLLHYPSVDYYYVSPARPDLERRISEGLRLSTADGSRDALFNEFFGFKDLLAQAKLDARTVIELRNDDAPPVPPQLDGYYFSVSSLLKQAAQPEQAQRNRPADHQLVSTRAAAGERLRKGPAPVP